MKSAVSLLLFAAVASAQNYKVQQITESGVPIVRLTDTSHGVEVSIMPSAGNRAYEMKVHGKSIISSNAPNDLAAYQRRAGLDAVPFLAPWANRLSEPSFWANGKKYVFNASLNNVPRGQSMHGMLLTSPLWKVTDASADAKSAHVTSKLEFWRYPDLMAQWPFAQEYEMTYSLSEGTLEVRTTITNLSNDPMPVAIGFHPYYRIPDVPRDEWTAHLPVRKAIVTEPNLIATGELKDNDLPDPLPLKGHTLDNGFTDLVRGADGRAVFSIVAGDKKVEVMFGPKYPVALVYLPAGREFICFEPMAALTNGLNLNHDGRYPDLQSVAPGAKWTESFWIRASGI